MTVHSSETEGQRKEMRILYIYMYIAHLRERRGSSYERERGQRERIRERERERRGNSYERERGESERKHTRVLCVCERLLYSLADT